MAALAGELCALSEEATGPAAGAIGLHPRDEPWGDVIGHLRGLALKARHWTKVRPQARHPRVHCSLQSCDRDVRGWGAGRAS